MRLSGPLLVACISLSGSLRGALKVLLHHPDGNVLSALGAALDGYDTDLCRHTDERHTGNDGVPNGQNTIRKTATVKNNENGSVWAKFPLAIRITRKDKDGNEK